MLEPIAYTYEADYHCPDCAYKRFNRGVDGFIAGPGTDGRYPEDSEGNPVGVVAPWDEWQQFDGGPETLACGTCGETIDEYEGEVS